MAESITQPSETLAFPMAGNGNGVNIQRRPRHPPLGRQQSQQRRQYGQGERSRAEISAADFETVATEHSSRSRSSLPSNVVLSPRADVWIYLCASSLVVLYSHISTSKMGAYAAVIIALLSINATLSLSAGVAYRFRPSLMALTRPIGRALGNLSLELLLAAVSLLLWALCMTFYKTLNDPAFQVVMKMYSANDWNANFFYSLWITGILSLYLVADLCAGNHLAGVITTTRTTATTMISTHHPTTARIWMLLFFSSILLLSISIMEKFGPMCNGPYLQNSPYCASTTVAIIASVLGMILCLAHMASRRLSGNNKVRQAAATSTTALVKTTIERVLALAILIWYACNAGITTSPGGSGANMGNVFIASWLSLILALMLNVNYLGLHFTITRNHDHDHHRGMDMVRKSSQNNYAYSEEEEDDETLPQIMYDNTAERIPRYSSGAIMDTERSNSAYARNLI